MAVVLQAHTIGELLALSIAQRRCSQRDAAKEIGMSPSTVTRIVQGRGFDIKWIIPIAKWCGLNPADLWELLSEASVVPPNPGISAGAKPMKGSSHE